MGSLYLDCEKYELNLIFLHNAIGKMHNQVKSEHTVQFIYKKELHNRKLVFYSNIIKFLPRCVFRTMFHISEADVEVIFPERIVPIFANKLTAPIKCSWNQTSINPEQRLQYFRSSIVRRLIYIWGKCSYKK